MDEHLIQSIERQLDRIAHALESLARSSDPNFKTVLEESKAQETKPEQEEPSSGRPPEAVGP